MSDKEKVIKGLEKIAEFFKARGDMAVGDGKMLLLSWMRAVEDAIALLKAQEPRVLSREEIINANGYIWKEYMGMWAMTAVLIEYGMERIPYKGDYSTLELDWRSYGVTWRCWNVCPTEEQREAAAWES